VLIDEDLELFDSTQIFEYFETVKPEPALWPAEAKARARARLLEHKSDEIYFPAHRPAHGPAGHARRSGRGRSAGRRRLLLRREGDGAGADGWPAATLMPTSPSTWRSSSASAWAHP